MEKMVVERDYRFEHHGITAKDIDSTVDFYKRNFGFDEVKRFDKPGLRLRGALLSLGGLSLEILSPYGEMYDERWITLEDSLMRREGHLALDVGDVQRAYTQLKENGVIFVTDILEGRFFFCRDNCGNLIEIKVRK